MLRIPPTLALNAGWAGGFSPLPLFLPSFFSPRRRRRRWKGEKEILGEGISGIY